MKYAENAAPDLLMMPIQTFVERIYITEFRMKIMSATAISSSKVSVKEWQQHVAAVKIFFAQYGPALAGKETYPFITNGR